MFWPTKRQRQLQRQIHLENIFNKTTQENCELWDIWSGWWGDMTWPSKRTIIWQRQLQLQWQLENSLIQDSCKHWFSNKSIFTWDKLISQWVTELESWPIWGKSRLAPCWCQVACKPGLEEKGQVFSALFQTFIFCAFIPRSVIQAITKEETRDLILPFYTPEKLYPFRLLNNKK